MAPYIGNMAVYIDNYNAKYGRMTMCHMVADTTEELLVMADKIGVAAKWIQDKGEYSEHFDVCLSAKKKAIEYGAIEISAREFARFVGIRPNAPDYIKRLHEGKTGPVVPLNSNTGMF